jgi:hypothetical protein
MIIGEYGEAHPKRALADAFGARGEIGADDRGVGRQVAHAMALAPSGEVKPAIGIGLLGARGDLGACELDRAVERLGERTRGERARGEIGDRRRKNLSSHVTNRLPCPAWRLAHALPPRS